MRPYYLGAEQRTEAAQAELSSGTYMAVGERLDWSYWDTQILAVANLQHFYFTQGTGKPFTTGAIKTMADSNILSENLPEGLKFTIKALKLFYLSTTTKANAGVLDLYTMFSQAVLSLKIANKDTIWQTTLSDMFGVNLGITHTPTVPGDSVEDFAQVNIRASMPINVDIVIAARTNWKMILDHTVAPAASIATDRLRIVAQGILQRLS